MNIVIKKVKYNSMVRDFGSCHIFTRHAIYILILIFEELLLRNIKVLIYFKMYLDHTQKPIIGGGGYTQTPTQNQILFFLPK